MPKSVFGIEWLNENANRRFPFADYASLTDDANTIVVPSEMFVDFSVSVDTQSYENPANFYMSELAIFGTGFSFVISYEGEEVTRASIPLSAPKNSTFYIYGTGSLFESVIGSVTVGDLNEVGNYGGVFTFSGPDQTGFVISCIKPDIKGISGVYIKIGDDISGPIHGPVILEQGTNISLEKFGNTVRINAINGEGFNLDCGVLDRPTPQCVRSINGVTPDENGNIQLQGRTCVEIAPRSGFIELSNTCKEPCCTSTDLASTIEDLRALSSLINTQDINIGKLEARMTGLERISDIMSSLGFVLPESE